MLFIHEVILQGWNLHSESCTKEQYQMGSLYLNGISATYFASCLVEHIPEQIKRFNGNSDTTTNTLKDRPMTRQFVDSLALTLCTKSKPWQML